MSEGVDDLVFRQSRISGVENGADAWNSVEQLEVAMGVPGKTGDPVAGSDPQAAEGVCAGADPGIDPPIVRSP